MYEGNRTQVATTRRLDRSAVSTLLILGILALTLLLVNPGVALAVDRYEVDDARTIIVGAVPGGAQVYRDIDPYGDIDWIEVPVAAGHTYVIETLPDENEWFDSKLDVFMAGSDVALASDDDGGTNLLSRVVLTAQTDAIWHVRVTGYSYYATGSYSLNVYDIAPSTLNGIVRGVAEMPVANARVSVYAMDTYAWDRVALAHTNESGQYSFTLSPGTYRLGYVLEGEEYVEEFYLNASSLQTAQDISLAAEEVRTLDDVNPVPWNRVTGAVYDENGEQPLASISIAAYHLTGTKWEAFSWTLTDNDGSWSMPLAQGTYKFKYSDASEAKGDMFYPEALTLDAATEVIVGSDPLTLDANMIPNPNADTTPPVTTSDAYRFLVAPAVVTFSATDEAGVADTFYRLNGGEWVSGTVVELAAGTHTIEYYSVDTKGNEENPTSETIEVRIGSVSVQAIAGADRFSTAVAISQKTFPEGADAIIIVTGTSWPDGLSAASLAGALDAPILLVNESSVPDVVTSEIVRLGASRIIIIGGEKAVSANVQDFVAGYVGTQNVERISGANRFETARLVAEATLSQLALDGIDWSGNYVLASGISFPDVLAASPLSAHMGWPVLLTNPDALPDATVQFLTQHPGATALVAGGPVAVSENAAREADRITDTSSTRAYGSNRYATAVALARYASENGMLDFANMAVATGQNFPDALTVSCLQDKVGSVLLLTPNGQIDSQVAEILESLSPDSYHEITFVGGASAISLAVRDQFVAHLAR